MIFYNFFKVNIVYAVTERQYYIRLLTSVNKIAYTCKYIYITLYWTVWYLFQIWRKYIKSPILSVKVPRLTRFNVIHQRWVIRFCRNTDICYTRVCHTRKHEIYYSVSLFMTTTYISHCHLTGVITTSGFAVGSQQWFLRSICSHLFESIHYLSSLSRRYRI